MTNQELEKYWTQRAEIYTEHKRRVMKTKLVAELGINHNGDLNIAKQLIDVACAAGCQYVKFQKRHIPLVYTPEELAVPRESPWGTTTMEQKKGLEFEVWEYQKISEYCKHKGVEWFASSWDVNSAALMGSFDTAYQKIPSALITNMDILEITKSINKPVIISTGMSTYGEVLTCLDYLGHQVEYVLHCTSTYPCKPEEVNLNCIPAMKKAFYIEKFKIGFSNHSPGLTFIPVAVAMGAEMIEFHITLDRAMYGSDQSSSIEPEGVFHLVKNIRAIEEAMGDGVKKIFPSEIPIMKKLRR